MMHIRWRSSNEPIPFGNAVVLMILVTVVTINAVELVVEPVVDSAFRNDRFELVSILAGGVAGVVTIAAWMYHKRIVCGVID